MKTLSDSMDEELPACLERSSTPPFPSLASASSHRAQSNFATLSGFVSVIDALRSLKTVPGATNELRAVDYNNIPIRQTNYMPQQYDGTVVFEFPPPSALNDVAQQMEGMDRKRDGHPWCKTFTTNIKNDHKLVFKKIVCAGKLVCHNNDCRFFRRDHIRNGQDWSGTFWKACKVGVQVPLADNVVCTHCKVPLICLAPCTGRMYFVLPKSIDTTRACVHLGSHSHHVSKGIDRASQEDAKAVVEVEIMQNPRSNPSTVLLKTARSLVQAMVLTKEGSSDPFDDNSLKEVITTTKTWFSRPVN